jgi:TetR/AcrR family transcriptional repressor of bet genes
MARPSNTKERRGQIARAFARVMAREGYEGASIVLAAREAGLAPGLVHYHFESKEEVLLTVIDVLAADARARIDRFVDAAGGGARDRLHAFVDAHLALGPDADGSAVACWVAIAAEAVRSPAVRAAYERAAGAEIARLTRLVADVLVVEHASARGAKAVAAAVYAAIHGYFTLSVTLPGAIPRGSSAPAVRAMADALVASGPEHAPHPKGGPS